MQHFWNERYGADDFAYGTHPNAFFKSVIDALPPGRLLVPGAGEGRDAVYAAALGWEVDAFDYSAAGRDKALRLAGEQGVRVHYTVLDAADFKTAGARYDLIALVFFHLPPQVRQALALRLQESLAPGGRIVLEAFTPRQLAYASGGPREEALLLTGEQVAADFAGLSVLECRELETVLDEGPFHQGPAAVVRYVGQRG